MSKLKNHVIHLKMYGGLGNQIFQLFAALILASEKKISRIVIEDSYLVTKGLKGQIEKLLNLEDLGVDILYKKIFISKFRIPRFIFFKSKFNPFISDRNFRASLNSATNMSLFMDGYFIDSIDQFMLDRYLPLIVTGFKKFENKNKNKNSRCVIHLRGTDFIGLGWNKVTPVDYYRKSIQKMKEIGVDTFDVVTDDIDYAKSFFIDNSNIKNYISTDTISDFLYLSSFKYKILSASTFAFWSSVFGSVDAESDSLTISPSFWTPELLRKVRLKNEIKLIGF